MKVGVVCLVGAGVLLAGCSSASSRTHPATESRAASLEHGAQAEEDDSNKARVEVALRVNGEVVSSQSISVVYGKQKKLDLPAGSHVSDFSITVHDLGTRVEESVIPPGTDTTTFLVQCKFSKAGEVLQEPSVALVEGQSATIEIVTLEGSVSVMLSVSRTK